VQFSPPTLDSKVFRPFLPFSPCCPSTTRFSALEISSVTVILFFLFPAWFFSLIHGAETLSSIPTVFSHPSFPPRLCDLAFGCFLLLAAQFSRG